MFTVPQFTLPDNKDFPAKTHKFTGMPRIADCIRRQLRPPKIQTRLRQAGKLASHITVTMPKTSMHEYDLLAFSKDDVRFSRQILSMEPIAISKTVQGSAHEHFWRRIASSNACHPRTAVSLAEGVHLADSSLIWAC